MTPFVIQSYTTVSTVPEPEPEKTGNNHSFWLGETTCGSAGRLAKLSELAAAKNLCEGTPSQWGLWKYDSEDGTLGGMYGPPSYECKLVAQAGHADNNSICTYNGQEPKPDEAIVFHGDNFGGRGPWGGQPHIAKIGETVEGNAVGSFKVGSNATLVIRDTHDREHTYQPNTRVEQLDYQTKSYRVTSNYRGKVAFIMEQKEGGESYSCVELRANGARETVCNNEGSLAESKILTNLPAGAGTMNMTVYLLDYERPGSVAYPTPGKMTIEYTKQGLFEIGSTTGLPHDLSVEQRVENVLNFTRF